MWELLPLVSDAECHMLSHVTLLSLTCPSETLITQVWIVELIFRKINAQFFEECNAMDPKHP